MENQNAYFVLESFFLKIVPIYEIKQKNVVEAD
jgi:hypothetical protein